MFPKITHALRFIQSRLVATVVGRAAYYEGWNVPALPVEFVGFGMSFGFRIFLRS